MSAPSSSSTRYAVLFVLPLAAVGTALYTQHGAMDLQPCPWCVLQRVEFITMALLGLLGLLLRQPTLRRGLAGLILLLAACGVATALWQHFVAAASQSCNLTFADRVVRGLGLDQLWPYAFAAYATCAEAAVKLLGISYEFYSLAIFVVLGAVAASMLRRR